MKAKQGNEHTNVEEIPEEWKVIKVKDLGEVITGTTPRTTVKEYWGGPYPFVTPTDISEAKYVRRTGRTVSSKGVEKGRLVPKDSVLVTCIASIGKIAMASQPSITNQQINAIICKPSVDPHYVYYAIDSKTHILRTWAGQTQKPIVKKSLFEEFPIAFPPLVEQRGISRVLSCVDDAIQKTNEVIEKTEMLKLGLMQRLLTQGIRHTDFKETDFGEIPKKWTVEELKAISLNGTQNGLYKKAQDFGSGCKFVRMTELFRSDILEIVEMERVRVSESELEKYKLNEGDLLFARRSLKVEGAGKCVLVPAVYEPVLFESSIIRVTLKQKIAYPRFYLYYFNSPTGRRQMRRLIRTVAVSGITGTDLQKIKLPVPPIKEQKEISTILSVVDERIMLENKHKGRLEELKKGLMQVLLTGKVRVKVD